MPFNLDELNFSKIRACFQLVQSNLYLYEDDNVWKTIRGMRLPIIQF